MKQKAVLVLIIFFIIFSNCTQVKKNITTSNNEVSTFYFIRHAEKDRSDKTNRNPHLTEAGIARAQHWKDILKNIDFDAVYSTDYYRTKETAIPLAQENNVDLTIYDANILDGEKLKIDNVGKTILVVGHSDTTPKFVNHVIGQEKHSSIDDSNNGNLYIVTIIGDTIADQVLEINPQ
jgi:phosphohistidine phosphatase SixA